MATFVTASIGVSGGPGGSVAFAAATANISGHLTDGGSPLAYTSVVVYTGQNQYAGSATTDVAGSYHVSVPAPGSYKIAYNLPGYVTQWHPQRTSFDEADWITVVDSDVTVDESVMPHGSLSGQVTNADGSLPAYFHMVAYAAATGQNVAQTDGYQGHYSLPYVPAGSYKLSFQIGFGGPISYAHQKMTLADADVFAVATGEQVIVDEQLPATGAIAGHVTNNGQPVSGVYVSANGATGEFYYGITGPDGSFRLVANPGSYQVSFQLPNGLIQYAYDKAQSTEADQVVVTGGSDTVVEEHVAPTGKISGHLLAANGTPAVGVSVTAEGNLFENSAMTDADGFYELTLFASTYALNFYDRAQTMWSPHTSNPLSAARYTVAEGTSTTVDDTLLATGSVTVTARDATTHAPILSFCAFIVAVDAYPCTDNGTVTFAAVGPGSHNVQISPSAPDHVWSNAHVTVASGQNAAVIADLAPAGTMKTVVRDTVTGAPVENACVQLVDPQGLAALGTPEQACSGADGQVELGYLTAGTFKAFVWAGDGVHGDQWVGLTGGVGVVARAKPVVIRAGQTTTMAPIKLDKAGTLAGTVTDAATSAPIPSAVVGLAPMNSGFGPTSAQTFADAQGRYSFGGLGPYDWAIFTSSSSPHNASAWSGNTGNRLLATTVKITAGQTTTYDIGMRTGTTLTGIVTGPQGSPIPFARIYVSNPITGDTVAVADSRTDGTYSVQVIGPQIVTVGYYARDYGVEYSGTVGGAHPTLVVIPGSGTKTLNVVATTLMIP